ncbi:tRNA (32-2'-O)-methyltransferase regulator THADA-like [Littorina saxatilis]|uniref:tRNA (32-2'-O)-methyltransferase regulator THADA-like n=1 Tax=Littorina saxatilis TaxID=31220 RepID=UPI0038B6A167
MDYFGEPLLGACEDYVKMTSSQNADLCAQVEALASCTKATADTKQFLADLKQVVQKKSLPNVDLLLELLVPLYLSLTNKNAAKKVLSSFLQGLPEEEKKTALQLLCQRVQDACVTAIMNDTSCEASVRHMVDNLTALMDNFALGETCVAAVASTVLEFLAQSEEFFFSLFSVGDQSAVQMNVLMHDCHVTMQVLNRFTQRHLPRDLQHLQHLMQSVIPGIMRKDIEIMNEEQMMVDCRCCCAINFILLLQIAEADVVPQIVNYSLNIGTAAFPAVPWLKEVNLSQLKMSILSPMTSLALLWGMLSMLNTAIITMVTTTKDNADLDIQNSVALECDLDTKEPAKSESNLITRVAVSSGTESASQDNKSGNVARIEKGDGCLMCEVMLRKLLLLDEKCQSTASRVQCIKTVTLWTTRIWSCLKEQSVPADVRHRLIGERETIQCLLNFVWTHWQDQLDAVRHNSRIVFDNCLKIHLLASQCEDASMDPFLLSLLHHVLEMGWSNHSKISALVSLVNCFGTQPVLHRQRLFPTQLLAQMADQGLACHASELYEVMIAQEKERGGVTSGSRESSGHGWLAVWIDPIITQLCSSNKKLKQHIIEYVLPRVMKKDRAVLEYMLGRLSSSQETGVEHLGALIVCLRRARAWGLMTDALHTQDSSSAIWAKIRSALNSPEEQVRLDAFALLCESKRTSEAISEVEFQHLQLFVTYNLNNQSPAFRQAMLAFIKKLFCRIKESQQALLRLKKKQKEEESPAALQAYSSFLSWLECFLFTQLYPSAAFARRTMSLAILSLFVEEVHPGKDDTGYKPLGNVTGNHVHTLLECLTDTFEENKLEAFKLLLSCTSNNPDLLTEEKCKALYSAAMQLAVSTRPQDCGTAAYVFKFLLHQPCSSVVVRSCKPILQSGSEGLSSGEHTLESTSDGNTPQPRKDTAEVKELKTLLQEIESADTNTSPHLQLLHALLVVLVDQISVAQTSLILAAANRPIYPTLHCVRYILDGLDFRTLEESQKPLWSKSMDCLLQLCLLVAKIVSPVVQNSSPEGNVPEEAVLGPGLKFDLGLMAEVEESRQTVSLMPEYLIVCCWRSIKEVSLLLGQLSQNVPITRPGLSQGLFSLQQVEEIGRFFKHQLMESLHRGAFELAYAGFVMMCQMLWKSPWSDLQTLPRRWLEEVMSAITSPGETSSLCATRRSAGVPFFIQAIVATETASSGRPSFHKAIGQLLHIALSSTDPESLQSSNTDGQVHALNILRTLFKDTRLGEDVAPYICDGLKAAILGFKSQFWEIRNSATLLLSALMTRIFGVKRSKDESVLSKRNSQTGRAFFHKYPALYQFLLTELDMATQNLGLSGHLHLHPSLYPVLMVLGRLFPSTMEGTTTRLNLAAFIPHVIKCSSSPVYKTRMMAARALQPLAGKEQLTSVLTNLLDTLPKQPAAGDCRLPQSHVHGVLLQVYHLLLLSNDMSGPLLQKLCSVCVTGWLPLCWLTSRQNPCLCTRKVALNVTDLILSTASSIHSLLTVNDRHNLLAISNHLRDTLRSELASPSPPYSPHTPFLSEFLSCVTALSMKYLRGKEGGGETLAEEVVLRLLGFEAYEVHLAVLDSLVRGLEEGKECSGKDDQACADITSKAAEVDAGTESVVMSQAVVSHLLDMGLKKTTYAETAIKIFELLSLCSAANIIGETQKCSDVFSQLLIKLQKERSAEVKAAMIQFSSKLLPFLCKDLKATNADPERQTLLKLLQEWNAILTASCGAEQPDDLHLSCAQVLQDNCTLLLADQDQSLGLLVFDFWTLLVALLQADDLEVKDVAASVSAELCSGGSHPEHALGQLICTMFTLHGKRNAFSCLTTVLTWITPQASDVDDGTERLFDKGELNTFQDQVALARTVTAIVQQIFQAQNHLPSLKYTQTKSSPLFQLAGLQNMAQDAISKHLQLTMEDEKQLIRSAKNVEALTDVDTSLAGSERDILECLYLSNSSYCDRTHLLIRSAFMVCNLQSVPELLQSSAEDMKAVCEQVSRKVTSQLRKHHTCNLLLRTLTERL